MSSTTPVGAAINWLRMELKSYTFEPVAIYRRQGTVSGPLTAKDEADLASQLETRGHFIALPRESAALANVIEVSVLDFLEPALRKLPDVVYQRGTERGYPDLEVSGGIFGSAPIAIDVKVARRSKSGTQTQSRITLCTGNTYFKHPGLEWPLCLRPYHEYAGHIDLLALYTFVPKSLSRFQQLEFAVHEKWRLASKQRSSTTREYVGAVMALSDLISGKGEFSTEAEFYSYWRAYKFKTATLPAAVLKAVNASGRGASPKASKARRK